LPDSLATSLVKLRNRKPMKPGRAKEGYLTFAYMQKTERGHCQILRVDVALDGSGIQLKFLRDKWSPLPGKRFGVPRAVKKHSIAYALDTGNANAAEALDWIDGQLATIEAQSSAAQSIDAA